MTEREIEMHLADIFENITRADGGDDPIIPIAPALLEEGRRITRVSTFAEADVLTSSAGVVIRLRDGSEFQITVVKSR